MIQVNPIVIYLLSGFSFAIGVFIGFGFGALFGIRKIRKWYNLP